MPRACTAALDAATHIVYLVSAQAEVTPAGTAQKGRAALKPGTVAESALAHGQSPFYWSAPDAPFKYDTGAITDADLVTALTGGAAPAPLNGAPYAVTGVVATSGAGQVTLS